MAKPIVAVVGRPNVGKSTFFNKMAGRRVSIVDDMPGVTRDRVYVDVEWCGRAFTLVDTGGMELKSEDSMWRHIKRQAELAVLQFATDLRGQSFGAFENHALSGNTFNVQPQFFHRLLLACRSGEFQFDDRH